MNKSENWLRAIHNDSPAWIPKPWEPFEGLIPDLPMPFLFDPISQATSRPENMQTDVPFKDAWGVEWLLQEGSPAPTPIVNDSNKVIKDITCWQDFVKFPNLDGYDWGFQIGRRAEIAKNGNMAMNANFAGLFEMSHNLMGFEDCLVNFMLEPEAMSDLLSAISDWKIGHLERVIDKLHPDVIHYHDDWGSKQNVFVAPDIWRKVLKPHHKRIVDLVKSHDILFMHHSDSICEPITGDMADMGIDIWQGAIPQNDIVAIQQDLDGRMAIMGGIDAHVIDLPDVSEETVRAEVRRAIDTYWPQGCFIPCIPNIAAIYPEVERIYLDEIDRYGKIWMASHA